MRSRHPVLLATVAACLAVCAALFPVRGSAAARPFAVWFYADWCMNCKLIAPKLAVVQPEFEKQVRFVKLNFTDASHDSENMKTARELGIYELYMTNHKTGWVALFDAAGKPAGALKQEMSPDEMRRELAALTTAAGE